MAPRDASIAVIADAFGVRRSWLVTGAGEKTREEKQKAEEERKEKARAESRTVYRAEDKKRLDDINLCISYLRTMQCSKEDKTRIHGTLSKIRAELEARVLFGE